MVGWPDIGLSLPLLCLWASEVLGHGRLIEPPSRASMWRYGFKSPPNYNDHETYCGGLYRQWVRNGGKCGVCGDAWDLPQPRPHEAGGTYGQGIIVRRYKKGAPFTIRVEITANHRGHFEFRLCKQNNPQAVVTEACLDQHVLRRAKTGGDKFSDNNDPTKFFIGSESKVYEMRYLLPPDLTCTQCVLQWRYIAGNNWGRCDNGTSRVGCGPQEEFRACADVSIEDKNGHVDETPYEDVSQEDGPQEPEGGEDEGVNEVGSLQAEGIDHFWLSVIIMLSAMTLALFIYILIFLYFYGANKTVKPCWHSTLKSVRHTLKPGKERCVAPVPPPRRAEPRRAQESVVTVA